MFTKNREEIVPIQRVVRLSKVQEQCNRVSMFIRMRDDVLCCQEVVDDRMDASVRDKSVLMRMNPYWESPEKLGSNNSCEELVI